MGNIFIVSDTHFHHENIIKYCNRPFTSAEEMDEKLVENWNSVVRQQDKVYHLGDVYFPKYRKEKQGILARLDGTKRLLLGNHDSGKDQFLQKHFKEIYMWRSLKEFGLLLTHVPVHPSSLSEKLKWNIHGHIHDKDSPEGPYKNACVEKHSYTPQPIESFM
jgi:calcineurin-like phosphoesterase family protein